jgi:hypothetical protein
MHNIPTWIYMDDVDDRLATSCLLLPCRAAAEGDGRGRGSSAAAKGDGRGRGSSAARRETRERVVRGWVR